MDHIWHTEGLDLRMTPYTCLSTGNHVGMIQVVRNAKTVYHIQRSASKLAAIQMDTTQLYKWIRLNKTPQKLKQAIETFTFSCAGYCVATFILGIKDRHPDNIMVRDFNASSFCRALHVFFLRSTKRARFSTSTSATSSATSRRNSALTASAFPSC